MPVYRASNLAGQVEFVNLDGSARWLGPRIGGHYWPTMHRTADGRWWAAHWTLDGYDGPPGRPMFIEVAADAAAGWFEVYRLEIPPDLVADLATRPAPPPAAGMKGTGGPPDAEAPGTPDILPEDPVNRTVEMLGGDDRAGSRLIHFLAVREGRKAHVDTIVREFRKQVTITDSKRRSVRKLAERTRQDLDQKDCPLRLAIGGNVVRLNDADPVA